MGNCFTCFSGEKSEEEKRFDELVKAVDTGEKDNSNKIYFQYTNLNSCDKVIIEAQKIVNNIHIMRNKLIKGAEELVVKTHIWEIDGANTSHAILALYYAIWAQCSREDAESLISFTNKFPWIKKGKDSKIENVARDSKILFDYLHSLESASQKLPKIIDECTELGKASLEIENNIQDEISEANTSTKLKAAKSIPHNIKMLKRTAEVSTTLLMIVKRLSLQLKYAFETMAEEKSKIAEFGELLAKKGITIPVECYRKVGKEVQRSGKVNYCKEDILDFPYIKDGKKSNEKEESKYQSCDDGNLKGEATKEESIPEDSMTKMTKAKVQNNNSLEGTHDNKSRRLHQ